MPTAIYDEDPSEASRDLVARFLGSPTFRLVAMLKSSERIDELIDARKVALVLTIDRRFTRDLLTGEPAPVQVIDRRPQLQHRAADRGLRQLDRDRFLARLGRRRTAARRRPRCSTCGRATTRP